MELGSEAWLLIRLRMLRYRHIKGRLPSPPEYHLVTNAIHFSFLPPCSAAELQQFPRICTDATGFDRSAFHKDFEREVIAFLRKHLPEQEKQ
jgi:predicted dienelactone hydrolase